jgi:YHS domain-containing protein
MEKVLKSLFLLLIVSETLLAQKAEVFIADGKAINGYDAIAYFTDASAVSGSSKFVYTWNGTKWYFSSDKNLRAFKSNPQKYAPQYGGYCAYGMSEGYKAPTDPHAWTIVNDKLYLNYNKDVKKMWLGNQTQRITKADKNWPKLKNGE